MKKLLVIPSNKEQFNLNCDGFIIGINGLSINFPCYFEMDDLKGIDKEIFVSLNKNMFNSDIKFLKETLLKLNDYNIKAVIYYDISIVNLSQKLNLNYDLVWHQEHMTTNYSTVNFWYKYNVKYAYISNDITLKEMIEIKENVNSKLITNVFGFIPIFNSKRPLITNYLITFNKNEKLSNTYLNKENNNYPIVEENGVTVYSSFILNGLKEFLELDYDYYVLNSFNISDEKFNEVLNIFKTVNYDNLDFLEQKLNLMFNNLKKGFFYEATVYKVK